MFRPCTAGTAAWPNQEGVLAAAARPARNIPKEGESAVGGPLDLILSLSDFSAQCSVLSTGTPSGAFLRPHPSARDPGRHRVLPSQAASWTGSFTFFNRARLSRDAERHRVLPSWGCREEQGAAQPGPKHGKLQRKGFQRCCYVACTSNLAGSLKACQPPVPSWG